MSSPYRLGIASNAPITPVGNGVSLSNVPLRVVFEAEPETLNELLSFPANELYKVDLARMNLLCATDLPGAENLNIGQALAVLDSWLDRITFETDRHLYRVTDPRYAAHYKHSEAVFRAEMLTQVLVEDLGVKYDMKAVGNFDFSNSTVAFIHGMIPTPGKTTAETPGGTCASMPVLIAAVGRRLGYPIKLVTTDSHVFCRWEGANSRKPGLRGRFNMEVTGGFSVFNDAYYLTWPTQITEADARINGHLISLTPAQEFALFLGARGHCGIDNGQPEFAARSYESAYRYDSRRPCYRNWFLDVAMKSDYEPGTPALVNFLAHRKKQASVARRSVFDDMGIPVPPSPDTIMPKPPGIPALSAGTRQHQPMNSYSPSRSTTPSPSPFAPAQFRQPLGNQP